MYENSESQKNPDGLLEEFPSARADSGPPGLARNQAPLVTDLEPGPTSRAEAAPCASRGTPGNPEAHTAPTLTERRSPWNTPLLPVKKAEGTDCRPVQDLWKVNEVTVTIHPVVPNPYSLQALFPQVPDGSHVWTLKTLSPAFSSRWRATTYSHLNGRILLQGGKPS